MPIVSGHGGYCCGIRHIYGFYGNPKTHPRYLHELDRDIRSVQANRLMEVTLTDQQLKTWWQELEKRGFRQVTRFRNSNSGNYVTVLHLIRKPAPLKYGQKKDIPTVFNRARDACGRFAKKIAPPTPEATAVTGE